VFAPLILLAAGLTLIPFLAAAFSPDSWARLFAGQHLLLRLLLPAALGVPYACVTLSRGVFRWEWFALYAVLPVAVSVLLSTASRSDPEQLGSWQDYLVLILLGLAVDLRWFEPAWPASLKIFGKMLLVDAGLYGFLTIRKLTGVGFNLRLRLQDVKTGLREFLFYAPIAIPLGLALGFLHLDAIWPRPLHAILAFVFTFLFVAVPEELFFRGWLQNLLERRLGRYRALGVTACLFGLSHFNKRALHFNWKYVLLAALAGVFYGRAWRQERRVGASAITHATVDTLWGLWLR
jgi:uncharacterized protein